MFYLAASQTALGGHKTYFYVYHNMPIEASTNSFKTPIFKGYSGCVLFGIIVASRAKVAPFAHCLLGGSTPKPLLPDLAICGCGVLLRQTKCSTAASSEKKPPCRQTVKTSSGTEALLSFYAISFAVILICVWNVPDKYFVVIPDVLQVCQLRLELCQVWLVCVKLPLQRIVFCCQFLQRRQLAVMMLIDSLGFFVRFDFYAMFLIEFCRPAGFSKLSVYRFRPTVIPDVVAFCAEMSAHRADEADIALGSRQMAELRHAAVGLGRYSIRELLQYPGIGDVRRGIKISAVVHGHHFNETHIHWILLCQLCQRYDFIIEPYYPKGKRGRPPMGIKKMLRMYLLQIWFNLSDPATEDAIYDSYAMRKFTGIDFMTESVPDETTLCKFRHLLEANGLNKLFFDAINRIMVQTRHMMKGGTIVDATIVNAPSSTKNAEKARDPEMHQTKKGNEWKFGMKCHIGVDAGSGLVHTITVTAANEHDIIHPICPGDTWDGWG